MKEPNQSPHGDDMLVIEAGQTERRYWKDIWLYRELFYFLVWRDLLVRYKQTAIGVAWALMRPALTSQSSGATCRINRKTSVLRFEVRVTAP